MKLRSRFAAATALFLICAAVSLAQAKPPENTLKFADLGDLRLQSGETIHNFRLAYRTLGTLNANKSNAVLWPTWLGGHTEDLLPYVGPGNVVDTSKYFVILVDSIGNGITTSPSNSTSQPRMRFPRFTVRDMVESEHRLITDSLHLSHLRAVMGVSMGGMQTFEWLATYPDFMDLSIPMEGSPQSTSYDKLLWTAQIDALELDPEWKGGNGTAPMVRGTAVYAEIGSMNVTSPSYRVNQTPSNQFSQFIEQTKKSEVANASSASDAIRQRQAIISLDIPAEYGMTLEQVARRKRAKLLVIVAREDHMVNPAPAIAFANAIGAPIVTLDSDCGHLSFTCVSIGPTVAKFLADPASASSTTLRQSAK